MTDKSFEWRMQGMIYAYNIAKKDGLEALEHDIKVRNVLKAPMKFTTAQINDFWDMLSKNMYNNMLTSVAYALHRHFGFGKKRLRDYMEKWNEVVNGTIDLNYLGNHFVTMEDYAVELNKDYDLGIDVEVVAVCQYSHDKEDKNYRNRQYLDGIINSLMLNGHQDAAEFLRKQKEKY